MESVRKIPTHVSIIMDGNGRWAKERGKERLYGHMNAVESVRAVIEASAENGVKYLSLYAFSEENWNRPAEEVDGLMSLMMQSIHKEADGLNKNGVRLLVLGNRSRLSDELNKSIDGLEALTASNNVLTVIIFLSYSGRWDILQAAKAMAKDFVSRPESIDEVTIDDFSSYLVTSGIPDPDLIIRTSGELRISNYLLWQCAYSEFYYTDVLWPDFRKEDYAKALDSFALRDRRYGKIR